MRDAAYKDIVKTYRKKDNFGVLELKQKIKHLRCTYNQELLKIKNYRSLVVILMSNMF